MFLSFFWDETPVWLQLIRRYLPYAYYWSSLFPYQHDSLKSSLVIFEHACAKNLFARMEKPCVGELKKKHCANSRDTRDYELYRLGQCLELKLCVLCFNSSSFLSDPLSLWLTGILYFSVMRKVVHNLLTLCIYKEINGMIQIYGRMSIWFLFFPWGAK